MVKKTNIHCVVFDLDGTLFSSDETIYFSTLETFNDLGIEVKIPKEKFNALIGHHFTDMFDELGIKDYDFDEFIEIYKKNYFNHIHLSKPFPGMRETIYELKRKGIKVGLLTTKSQGQAEKILSHFNLISQFDGVMGRREGIAHKPSKEPLLLLLKEIGCDEPEKSLMVGDSELDIQCGKAAGAFTAAVTFGYRTKRELQKEKPDFIINELKEILALIENNLNGEK